MPDHDRTQTAGADLLGLPGKMDHAPIAFHGNKHPHLELAPGEASPLNEFSGPARGFRHLSGSFAIGARSPRILSVFHFGNELPLAELDTGSSLWPARRILPRPNQKVIVQK